MSLLGRRFLGKSTHPVDKKGRMSISKRFQAALDLLPPGAPDARPSGVLMADPEKGACLWVLNGDGFEREMEHLDRPALAADSERDDQRDVMEFLTEFTLDTSGRLVIPERFRALVGIQGSCVAIGMGSRLELWAEEAWEARPRGKRSPLTDEKGRPRGVALDDSQGDE